MANRKKEPTDNPQITIVIGTLNRPAIVSALLDQLIHESKKTLLEVIVIDQSIKKHFDVLKKQFPTLSHFRLIHFEKPNTCAYLNRGWKEAKAPIVLYLDDDVSMTERTIQAHLEAYEDTSVQAVAGRVINEGEAISTDPGVGQILWCGAIFNKNFSATKKMLVDFPYGCNMSYRKQVLEELGGFDEQLKPPIYSYNEIDMGVRVNRRYTNSMIFIPEALVHHKRFQTGGTRDSHDITTIFHCNQYNYGYFLGKNYSWIENMICFGRRLMYQLLIGHKAIPYIWKGFIYAKKHKK